MRRKIRIGSRESKLAVIQAEIVKGMIERKHPEITVEIITMKTTGDRILDQSLDQVGGKGLFVKELDQALLADRIDLAVHSLKDLPMEIPKELPVIGYTKREDPRDVLIYRPGCTDLPQSGIVGTSSRRRALQLKTLYPECVCRGIRGNVQTRLRKLAEEDFAATVLAAAGLRRLKMEAVIGRTFSVAEMVPAAGQGILAVQGRATEALFRECVNDPCSEIAGRAERRFIEILDGGCTSPTAAHAMIHQQEIKVIGLYYRESDGSYFVETKSGVVDQAEQLAEKLAKEMANKYE